jgi:enoyl-CoA hydratase/carnithine racemase
MSVVATELADGVATVTVDSPPVNAMSREVLEALERTASELRTSPEVRAIVLTGTGEKAFMAGGDISSYEDLMSNGDSAMAEFAEWGCGVISAWATMPQPVIAAAQASAVGGGLEIALACDLIVLDAEASVGLPEVKLGLIPGGGGTQRLAQRVGPTRAKRLMMLGSVIPAEEALAIGLVDLVADSGTAIAEAMRVATKLAALPAVAVQAIKHAVDQPRGGTLEDGIAAEHDQFKRAFASDDFSEGYKAFVENRKPVYRHS